MPNEHTTLKEWQRFIELSGWHVTLDYSGGEWTVCFDDFARSYEDTFAILETAIYRAWLKTDMGQVQLAQCKDDLPF